MVMPREKFIDSNNESKYSSSTNNSKNAKEQTTELGEEQQMPTDDGNSENTLSADELCRRSCARWADIVKKGQSKRPVPSVMGGASYRATALLRKWMGRKYKRAF